MITSNLNDGKVDNQKMIHSRARYIPAPAYSKEILENRERSDRFKLLKGNWERKDFSEFDNEIKGKGHSVSDQERSFYPCGAFIHTFSYQKDEIAPLAYLNFDVADFSVLIWLNGNFLGDYDLSTIPAELHVTDSLEEGENALIALIVKRQDGEIHEQCKDCSRNVILPNVYLNRRPEQHVRDYFITTRSMGDEANVCIRFSFKEKMIPVTVSLLNKTGELVAKAKLQNAVFNSVYSRYAVLSVKNPTLWNPDKPYFYTLLIETDNEVLVDRVGLRDIHVDEDNVYLNGAPVRFRNSKTGALL